MVYLLKIFRRDASRRKKVELLPSLVREYSPLQCKCHSIDPASPQPTGDAGLMIPKKGHTTESWGFGRLCASKPSRFAPATRCHVSPIQESGFGLDFAAYDGSPASM